jgi:acetyl-CoA carboxylase biotin carboxylase subunit
MADESVCIGPPASKDSYLNMPALIAAAEVTDAQGIHPGYGFLSENADFAERVEESGFVFIGPRAGDHSPDGRQGFRDQAAMKQAGVPCVPGSAWPLGDDLENVLAIAKDIGYPVIIKAAGGGGGRGMRVVHTEMALLNAVTMTRAEARAPSAMDQVYMEKFLENPRHIEFQVLADGTAMRCTWASATARCSGATRRSSRKRPRPAFTAKSSAPRSATSACAPASESATAAQAPSSSCTKRGEFYFIEMNTRIQVEHPVTEMVTGVDIVNRAAARRVRRAAVAQAVRHRHARACHRMPHQCRGPKHLHALAGHRRAVAPAGRPRHPVETHLYSGYKCRRTTTR